MKKQIYVIASLVLILSTTTFFIMTTKKDTPQNPVQLTEVTAQEEAEETDPQEEITTEEEKNNSDASSQKATPVPKMATQEPKATAATAPVASPATSPVASPAPAPKTQPSTQVSTEKQMLNLINSERAKVGAQPLAFDVKVVEVAQVKSADMVKNNYFSHTSPTYGSPFDMLRKFGITFSGAAENIALNSSVEAAHAAFMASEGHRKNILNPSYNRIGIGITDGPKGKVFVQMFIQK